MQARDYQAGEVCVLMLDMSLRILRLQAVQQAISII
jgi:hypothetical protein